MPRPQFTLRSLLVAMLVVAAFFAGARWQRQRDGELMQLVIEQCQRQIRFATGEERPSGPDVHFHSREDE